MKRLIILLSAVTIMSACKQTDENIITRSDIKLESDVMTPEALWAMGRIGSYAVSPDGQKVAYQVSYYSVEEDRSNTVIYLKAIDQEDAEPTLLGPGSSPTWLDDNTIAYSREGDVWKMNTKGKARKQLTQTDGQV